MYAAMQTEVVVLQATVICASHLHCHDVYCMNYKQLYYYELVATDANMPRSVWEGKMRYNYSLEPHYLVYYINNSYCIRDFCEDLRAFEMVVDPLLVYIRMMIDRQTAKDFDYVFEEA